MSNSNDVQLARVSKLQRTGDISKTDSLVPNSNRRFEKNIQKNQLAPDIKCNLYEETKLVFENISPKSGIASLSQEVESPDHTQRDTNESDNNVSSCSTLDIGKVEHLTLQQLEVQVRDLTQQLQRAEKQRQDVQRKLDESNAEKELCFRRLEVVSAAHECRITEMHCVIAELNKKLRVKQENTIMEEQEPDDSEISFQDGSVYNSEMNLTNPDAECQTDPLDVGDYSNGDGLINPDDNLCASIIDDLKINETANKCQVEALQEEVLHLKAQIALLQSEIANSLQLGQDNENINLEERPSFVYCGEEGVANESNCSLEQLRYNCKSERKLNNLNAGTHLELIMSKKQCEVTITSPLREPAIPKMAERVKLRCNKNIASDDNIKTTDLRTGEIKIEKIVGHFGDDCNQDNRMSRSFTESTKLDNELKLLQRKVEHLKVRNTVVSLTLDECKEHCEHLYLLCGKYESNAIALQTAVNCSDRAIEAYDVMLALLESKLALMKERSIAAEDSRKAVESVARHLLDRFESERNTCENSLGPWQNTFSLTDKAYVPWTCEDDNRLRYHVSKLKGCRSTVQNTIVNLESPFSDLYEKARAALEKNKELQDQNQEKIISSDLEIAVSMQEMLSLREENIKLKTQVDEAGKGRQQAVERANVLEDALKQIATDSKSTLFRQDEQLHLMKNRVSYSEAEHAALTEQQLVEALTRESELKCRIQMLIASVSASQKMSDDKYDQLQNSIRELQKSNVSLGQLLEQNKRKYQTRTRKLEQKIMEMSLELTRCTNTDRVEITLDHTSNAQQQRKFCIPTDTTLLGFREDHVPETTL